MTVLVGKQAPDFVCPAVLPSGELVEQFCFLEHTQDKYRLLFFYPLDFTFVCPSELLAVHNRIPAFKKLNVEVLGVSIDSKFTHHAWRSTPVEKGGIGSLDFTLLSDISHHICRMYDLETPEGVALRGAILIDKQGIVRAEVIHDLPIGRNIDELLRVFEAMQFHEQHGEVCPAGWKKGQTGMVASSEGVSSYLANHSSQL